MLHLEDTIKVADAAALCGVHRVTIGRWIKKGVFRAVRPPTGRGVRILKADLYEYLEKYQVINNRRKEGSDARQESSGET